MTAMVRVAVVKMRMEAVRTMVKEIAAKTAIGAEALTSLEVKKTATTRRTATRRRTRGRHVPQRMPLCVVTVSSPDFASGRTRPTTVPRPGAE